MIYMIYNKYIFKYIFSIFCYISFLVTVIYPQNDILRCLVIVNFSFIYVCVESSLNIY